MQREMMEVGASEEGQEREEGENEECKERN